MVRWLAPVAVAGVIALIASGVFSADANPNLAPQTAGQLLASVAQADTPTFSGTVVEKASLGLPELPNLGGDSSTSSQGLLSLLSGSHTTRIWYGGPTKQRVALLDSLGEQDVFRNGRDLWQWDSNSRVATHTVLPAGAAAQRPVPLQTSSMTPAQAAQEALKMIDSTTTVTTDHTGSVAGRSAYTLVLTPKDSQSLVGSVRLSLDGATRVPLGVQVFARGSDRVAFDVSFTQVRFSTPGDEFFTFDPPPNATVKQGTLQALPELPNPTAGSGTGRVRKLGAGWTTIFRVDGVGDLTGTKAQAAAGSSQNALTFLSALPTVSGTWGSGRLFSSALVNALLTSDGRLFVGSVPPELLYQAAAQK
jgi:outer membrane lipoprotein-sorting protein